MASSVGNGKRRLRHVGEVGVGAFASHLESIAMMEPVVQFEVGVAMALGRENKL